MVSAFNLAFILCVVSVAQAATYKKPQGFTENAILVKWTTAQDTKCRISVAAADQCWLKACSDRTSQAFVVNLLVPTIEEGPNSGNAWAECTAKTSTGKTYSLSGTVAEDDVYMTVIG
ncbi:hypothetical protein CBOM_03068 [Ceraceosorus bombacis]|uniref:Uncharacterized protein n=1 Tax=Ceraceosorus bombacis TaxID=401625 RepID=A0A0P1BMW6_9BASI|nr:hypothetical protein CBOM_03068 [Ceraceosorus bombacis]